MYLPKETFRTIVENTPLVSIDLIVRDSEKRVLLGMRENEPARGSWFVPGGRIFKDERRETAIARICKAELGLAPALEAVRFVGLYEHFYETNALGEAGMTTHYVVLAHELEYLDDVSGLVSDAQHGSLEFFSEAELLERRDVHGYTKDYFSGSA